MSNNLQKHPEAEEVTVAEPQSFYARICGFAENHRFDVAYAIVIISSLFLIPALFAGMQGDINLYLAVSNDLFEGKMPYRDRVLEYPPYVIPIFILPRIFGEDRYLEGFTALA